MAVSFVAASSVVTGANPTVAVPAGYAQGDLLIITTSGTATPTTPTGWTSRTAQGATGFVTIFYKFATGSESSVALTVASPTTAAVMLAYRGASAIDALSVFTTATSTSLATSTLVTTYANEYVISVYASNTTTGATWTAPASTTSRVNSSNTTGGVNGLLIVDELQATAGVSAARTATVSASNTLSAVAFSIVPSGRYWVGGAGTWSTATTNWSFTSGGASGAPAPTAVDSVFFDQAGTYSVTASGSLTCLDITVSAGIVTFIAGTTPSVTVSGSLSFNAGVTWVNLVALNFNATSAKTLTSSSAILSNNITFNGFGGTWTLNSNVSFGTANLTTLTLGTIACNGFTLAVGNFSSSGTGVRSINFGTGAIELQYGSATTVLDMTNATNFTCSGTGGFTSAMGVTRTFIFGTTGGSTTNAPNLSLYLGSSAPTFTTGSWFNTLNFTGSTGTATTSTVNVNSINTAGAGVASLSVTMVGTGTFTGTNPIAALTINTAGSVTFSNAVSCTTYTQTAGSVNFASFNLTCSSTATFSSVTPTNIGTISCTVCNISAGTFAFSQGTLNPSGGLAITGGAFTYSGTAVLSATVGIGQSAGSATFNKSYALNATAVYTLTTGTLTIGDGITLSVGQFSSSGTGTRSIVFGTTTAGNIALINTTAGVAVLLMTTATGCSISGPGGFTADASVTRTFDFGSVAGGTSSNAPNLTITTPQAAVPTIVTSSWFNLLNFTTTTFNPGTTALNLNGLTLASGGTYSTLSPTMRGTGTITSNGNTTLTSLVINAVSGTTSLGGALTIAGTTTLTSGALNLNGFNLTTNTFSSSNTNVRSIAFSGNFIYLVTTTAGSIVLGMGTLTGFSMTYTGVGVSAGGFSADASVTRTYTVGTTGGSNATAPNLAITSGSSIPTFTTGGWFNQLIFTGSSTTPAVTSITCAILILATGGNYTNLSVTMSQASGVTGVVACYNKTIAAFTVNTAGTTQLTTTGFASGLNCTSFNMTAGTLDFATLTASTNTTTYTAGSMINISTITCGTFDIPVGSSYTLNSGTINPTLLTVEGSFTYSSGGTLGATTAIFQTGTSTVTLNQAYSTVGNYNLTGGTLTLNNNTLSCYAFLQTGSTTTRSIAFGTGQITLTGWTATIFDGGSTGFTYTGTIKFVSTYSGSSGTRTINVGTGWTESTAIDVKAGAATGISIGTSGTDTVVISGNLLNLDLTGMLFTYSAGVATVYGNFVIPATGGSIATSANTVTFASTNATARSITTNNRSLDFPITIAGVGGTFQLTTALTQTAAQTLTLTNGTLNLNGFNLTTGQFSSSTTTARAVTFGSNFIYLIGSGVAIALDIGTATLFTPTGTGGFSADASVARTYQVGSTAGGSATTVPNLFITSGSSAPTITNNSNFNNLDFTGSSTTPIGGTISIYGSLTLSSGGTYTTLNIKMSGTGTITTVGKTISGLTINNGAGTATLAGALGVSSFLMSTGTFNFASFNLTCSATATYTAGTLTNVGTISCTTFTINGSFNFSQGTINASTGISLPLAGSSFTYNVGATLGVNPTFNHTNGSVILNQSLTTGTYTFLAGTLTLNSSTLSAAAFLTTGTGTRSIAFGTGQITLTGNAATIWDGGGANITYTGTVNIVSTYTGATGSRTINVGTGWTESNAFDVKVGAATGISIGSSGTDTVVISGNLLNLDLTGMLFAYYTLATTVYGNYTIPATGGSIVVTGSSLTFASTSATPRVLTVGRAVTFPIIFNGIGGTFNLGASFTTGTGRTTTLTNGTLNLNGYNFSTGLFSVAVGTAGTIAFGTNNITVTGTGTVWDSSVITGLTITGTPLVNVTNATATATIVNSGALPESQSISFNFTAGTYALTFLSTAGDTAKDVNFTGFAGTLNSTQACTIYGSYTLPNGMTVITSSNTLTFGATSGTKTITTRNNLLPPVTINGLGGTFNLGSNLTTAGLLQILAGTFSTSTSNYSVTCDQLDSSTITNVRSISLNNSTVSIVGVSGVTLNSTNLTFNAGTSQITLSNTTSTGINATGGATFYNVSFTGGAPSIGIFGTNTYNNLTFTNGATSPSFATINNNQTISGTLSSVSTNASTRLQLLSGLSPTQVTISAASVSLTDVDFQGVFASGAAIPFTGTRLGNLGNNTNITFTAGKTVYWSLAVGGNWNSVAWATSSGGTPSAANFPLAQDTCIIDNTGLNTSGTITVNSNFAIGTLNMSTRSTAMTLATGTTQPTIFGNWTNSSSVTLSGTGSLIFVGSAQTLNSAGVTFTQPITINSVNGTLSLAAALTTTTTSTTTLTSGTLALNGFNLTTGTFISNNTNTRAISFGSNFIYLTNNIAASVNLDMATLTGFSYTGAGGFSAIMSTTRTFYSGTTAGGTSSNAPNLFLTSGASVPSFNLSWFGLLDVTGNTSTLTGAPIYCNSLTLGGGVYTSLSVSMVGTGTIIGNSKTMAGLALLAGSTTISGTLNCVTFTVNGATFNFSSGTLNPAGAINISSGSFTYGGTAVLGPVSTFNHTAGNVTFNLAYSLALVSGIYTLTSGTLTLGANLTVGTFSSSNTNVRSIAFGSNYIILATTTAGQSNLAMADITNFSYTATGAIYGFQSTMSVTRTFTLGSTAGGSNTTAPSLALVSGASTPTFTTGSWFNLLDFGTTATATISTTSINLNQLSSYNSSVVLSNLTATMVGTGTINTGANSIGSIVINSGSGTTTCGNNSLSTTYCVTGVLTSGTLVTSGSTFFSCLGTFTYNGGTYGITTTLTCTTFILNGPTFNFSSGTITPSTSVVITSGSFTYSGTASLGAVATFTHTAGSVTFNKTYSLTTLGTYTLTAGNLTISGSSVNLNTGIFSSDNSNTRSIAFIGNINLQYTTPLATVLSMNTLTGFSWSGTGGFITDASITRGFSVGTNAGGSTTTAPNLTFTAGGSTITINPNSWFNNLNFGSTALTLSTTTVNITGSLLLPVTGTYTGLSVNAVGTGSLTTNSQTISALTINTSGTITAINALTITNILTLTQGTLYTNNNISSSSFASTGTLARSILGTNIIYTLSGAGATAFSNASGTGLTMTGITINMTSASAKTFAGGGGTYPVLNQGGTGALTITGANTFDNITNSVQPATVTFPSATITTVRNFSLSGIAGSLLTINASTAASAATLSQSSGIVYGNYLSIQDSTATGGATWYAGPTSTSVSNNTGWIFTQLPIVNLGNISISGGVVFSNNPV